MDSPVADTSILLVVFDLVGIFVFAISGGLVAVRKELDLFGVLVLAGATGLGGGMVRDLLAGRVPIVFRSELYATPALVGAAIPVVGHEVGLDHRSCRDPGRADPFHLADPRDASRLERPATERVGEHRGAHSTPGQSDYRHPELDLVPTSIELHIVTLGVGWRVVVQAHEPVRDLVVECRRHTVETDSEVRARSQLADLQAEPVRRVGGTDPRADQVLPTDCVDQSVELAPLQADQVLKEGPPRPNLTQLIGHPHEHFGHPHEH